MSIRRNDSTDSPKRDWQTIYRLAALTPEQGLALVEFLDLRHGSRAAWTSALTDPQLAASLRVAWAIIGPHSALPDHPEPDTAPDESRPTPPDVSPAETIARQAARDEIGKVLDRIVCALERDGLLGEVVTDYLTELCCRVCATDKNGEASS